MRQRIFMNFDVQYEQEDDGCWISEIPGVLAYGVTPLQAGARARALVFHDSVGSRFKDGGKSG